MAPETNRHYENVTREFEAGGLWSPPARESEISYAPVPHLTTADSNAVWRIRFDLVHDPSRYLGLELNGEVVLGREKDMPGSVGLSAYDADSLGVSRRHALLRPTETSLYVVDLGSTNGTWQNGHSIGVNMPYRLMNGDLLRLGRLEFLVKIIKRPVGRTGLLPAKDDRLKALVSVARAITSQLDFDEVLHQALDLAMASVSADEASVWLVDEQTGELFLEASSGIQDEHIKRLRLPVTDTLAGKAIEAGKSLSLNNARGGEKVKVKTGYLVEALIYVPLILGGVAFGVLSAAHRKPGNVFTPDDEKVLTAIAELTAVAVQNARLHQAATEALSRQTKVVTALHYALSVDLKNMANATIGYAGLLSSEPNLTEYSQEIVQRMAAAGNQMVDRLSRLMEVSLLTEGDVQPYAACNLVEIMGRAVRDVTPAARAKLVRLDAMVAGEAYLIRGDANRLYRSLRALVTNALHVSPAGESIRVEVEFRKNDLSLRVHDAGPAIAADDLSRGFDEFVRGGQTAGSQAEIELGLALVRATVEAHRGTVSVRNLTGRGVEFSITLPATLRLSAASEPPTASAARRL